MSLTKRTVSRMGLDVVIKGHNGIHMGYIGYGTFRGAIIASMYDKKCFDYFFMHPFQLKSLTEKEQQRYIDHWNKVCDDDLDLFLCHSDCGGKFTPKECRTIYKALQKVKLAEEYSHLQDTLDKWLELFKFCADNRRTMFYR